jgi:hypothetical protein
MTDWQNPTHGCDYGWSGLHEAFRAGWEQDPQTDDGHGHRWSVCSLDHQDGRDYELFVRCSVCLCPRCGHYDDENPCMERRHHDSLHIYLDGSFEPLGGILL